MKKINKKLIVIQEEISDCGVCSLLSIIRYYGGNISLDDLRVSSLTSVDGVSVFNLSKCAREYGFDSVSYKFDKIPTDNLPCIAHVEINHALNHFIVIYNVNDNKIKAMDPATGERELTLDEFYNMSTGVYILLKPKGKISYQINTNNIKNIITQFIHNHYYPAFKIILYNLIFIISSILYSFNMKVLLTNLTYLYILLFLFLIFIINIMTYLININIGKLNKILSNSMINDFLLHIFNLPLKYIHIKDSNEIVKRVLELDSIKETILSFIITLVTNLFVIILVSIILFFINKYILIIILFSLILYLLIIYIYNKNIKYDLDKIIKKDEEYNSYLIDYICGLNSIKHTASEDYYRNKLSNTYKNINDIKYTYDKHILKMNFLKQSFITSMEFTLNIFMIKEVINNNISLEYLFVINFLFQLIINSIVSIGNYIPGLIYQKKVIIKLNEFYNVKEEDDKFKNIIFKELSIKDLSFSYNGYKKCIDNFNLLIKNKDKLIIKGESGSGKSTLCKIINKEYNDYTGKINVNNINYKNISNKNIRNLISYSSQNENIFHGTIRDNILMGHEISDEKLNDIIDTCELNRIINKKIYGLDNYLYGGGSELSGGERQLIFLARSLVLDKQIIILDETLSEVNDAVEDKILNKLFTKYKDKTIIYVSHKNKKNYFKKTIYV